MTREHVKAEAVGLAGDLWKVVRKTAASSTIWVGLAAVSAERICDVFGCDAVKTQDALLVFGAYVVRELMEKWRSTKTAAAPASVKG